MRSVPIHASFAPLVSALAEYNERVQQAEERYAAARARVAQDLLAELPSPPLEFDAEVHELCERMLREVSTCSSPAELPNLSAYTGFVAATGPFPANLLDKCAATGDLQPLRRLVAARERRASKESAAERQSNAALFNAETAACESKEVAEAEAAVRQTQSAAREEFSAWLARSDHLAMRTTAQLPYATEGAAARVVRISSHNVQEHVHDGLSTFIGALPFVSGDAHSRLMAAMLSPEVQPSHAFCEPKLGRCSHPLSLSPYLALPPALTSPQRPPSFEVRARQCMDVADFVAAELEDGVDAVCLQEVTADVLAAVRSLVAARGWSLHTAGTEDLLSTLEPGRCAALTCIVTARAAEPCADIEVRQLSRAPPHALPHLTHVHTRARHDACPYAVARDDAHVTHA